MKYKDLPDNVVMSITELGERGKDIEKTVQFAAAGHITLELLISQAIFLHYTQDNNTFKALKKEIGAKRNTLIKYTISALYSDATVWDSALYTKEEKIDISFQLLGYEYLCCHYDILYNIFVKILREYMTKYSYNISKAQQFNVGDDDFVGDNQDILNLSSLLNINYSLLFFSLCSRSQLGIQVWQQAGVPLLSFLNPDKLAKQKRLMFNIGKTVVLLVAYEYCYNACFLDSIDINSIYSMFYSTNQADYFAQLHKVFQTDTLATVLFDSLNLSKLGKLSNNDKSQIFKNVAFSLFISNFKPGNKFIEVFSDAIKKFYTAEIEFTVDYRYAVYSMMNRLNIEVNYINEQFKDTYTSTIIINKKFVFKESGQFQDKVKKSLWKKVYANTIQSTENLFCGVEPSCSNDLIMLIVERLSCISAWLLASFKKRMLLLDANSIADIGVDNYIKILNFVKSKINNVSIWRRLKSNILFLNENSNIYADGKIIKFTGFFSAIEEERSFNPDSIIQVNRSNCVAIYQNTMNPNEVLEKKLIDLDYKVIKHIKHLSDEVAKYAIDKFIDAFNYIELPSQNVYEYYQLALSLLEQENNVSGSLICIDSQAQIIMFDSNRVLSEQIYELIATRTLKRAVYACGYCFKSGLTLLDKIISKTVFENIPVQFVVGSLQKYRSCLEGDGTITGIDKATVKTLNQYLQQKNVQLYTCENRFYHGKIYLFEAEKESVICLGSSNISRSAYASNYELNIGFIVQNDSQIKQNFEQVISRLIKSSIPLEYLEETVFGDNEINTEGGAVISKMSLSSVQKRIDDLTSEEVKYRLNLWMSYSPTIAAEDLGIKSLPNYFVFVYPDKQLMVLESFIAGNAYFCLKYKDSFESELNKIIDLSKTEIFQYSKMSKRGYHITNKFTLENNIRRYFR